MVKVNDLSMNLIYFQNSKTWDYGTYKILDSDIQNYGARKADGTLEVSVLERILHSHENKALNQIKKDIDTKGILNVFSWSDLANTRFIEALPLVMEAQLSGMITDGNKEIKKGSSYSGAGVDASIDASNFLLSHDRIYKAAEDVWFNYQLDKYEIEEGEDEHGNTTYSLIDNAEGTVVVHPTQVILTPQQEQRIIDEAVRKLTLPHTSDSKFDLVNINGVDVIQPKAGRDFLMLDPSGNPVHASSPHSVMTHAQGEAKFMLTTEIAKIYAPKQFVNDEIAKVDKSAEIQTLENSMSSWNTLMQGKQNELTAPQKLVIQANPFSDAYKSYLDNLIAGGAFLGDVPVNATNTDAEIASAIKAKFPSPHAGDHVEVIKPAADLNSIAYITYTASISNGTVTWTAGVEKDVHLKGGAVDAYTKAEMDAKLQAKQNTIVNMYRLMSETATADGVHIKRVGGYHSESSFGGGAFLGIAKDDYSVMGAFKFLNDIPNIRFRDKGGAMTDLPIHDIYNAVNKVKAAAAVLEANAYTDADKAKVNASLSKTEAEKLYEPITTTYALTTTHQAGYIIANENGIENVPVGSTIKLDLKGIDDMMSDPTKIPAAGDQLFIGAGDVPAAVRIPNSSGTAALKWETKTNATDVNIKDNYKTKYFVLKKIYTTQYNFVRLEDKPIEKPTPHWETIDLATYKFTKPERLRITYGQTQVLVTTKFNTGNNGITIEFTPQITIYNDSPIIMYLHWDSAHPSKLETFTLMNGSFQQKVELDIAKCELWKDA